MSELRDGIGSGARWSMLDNFAQQFLSFLVFMLLARMLAPEQFGLLAVAHLMVTLFRQIVFDAIAMPITRAPHLSDELCASVFALCLFSAGLLASVMFAVAGVLARCYAQPQLEGVLSWMSLVVIMVGCGRVYEARLVRQLEFRPLAIRSVVSISIGGVVGCVAAARGAGVMALVWQQLTSASIALLLLVRQSDWTPSWSLRLAPILSHYADISRVSLTGLFSFLNSNGDTLLVSLFLGSYATGIYSFAKRLVSAIYLVIGSSMLKLALPAFADAGHNQEARRTAYVRILGITLFLMAPMLLGAAVLAEPIIHVIFGEHWSAAAPIIVILAALHLCLMSSQINDSVFFSVGARNIPVRRGLLQVTLAIALGWSVASGGLVMMSAAFLLAALLVWPWMQHLSNRQMNTNFVKLACAIKAPVLACVVMLLFLVPVSHLMPETLMSVLGVSLGGALIYLLTHMLVLRMSPGSYDAARELARF